MVKGEILALYFVKQFIHPVIFTERIYNVNSPIM